MLEVPNLLASCSVQYALRAVKDHPLQKFSDIIDQDMVALFLSLAKEREVFGRPIGKNQGIQFPLAESFAKLETAELMVQKAASLYDRGQQCGKEANIAKYMAAEAACEAADRAIQTHGGYGYIKEYDVERYWREARLFRIAPISQEMVLNYIGEHVLGLPKSY